MNVTALLALLGAIAFAVTVALARDALSSMVKGVWRRIRRQNKIAAATTPGGRGTAAEALLLNIASTNKRLRDIIDSIVKGNFTSPALRSALNEVRDEFLRLRSSWVVIGDTDILQKVEHWHDDIGRVKDDIANAEGAWMQFANTSPIQPPDMMTLLPAKKRLGEYQALLAKGEELEAEVNKLREPKSVTTTSRSEEERARSRLATRLMMLAGQFDTLEHALTYLSSLDRIERVLRDIETLAENHSHADLDEIGDADLGKVVIAYHRDVRGALESVRDVAKHYMRIRAMSEPEKRLESSLTQARAYAAQCSREGKRIAETARRAPQPRGSATPG